jgi:hypothetical protein
MSQTPETTPTIEERLGDLIDQAHDACGTTGEASSECAAAWDAVEEVQAEMSHRRTQNKSTLQNYCDTNPDAVECRVYDV